MYCLTSINFQIVLFFQVQAQYGLSVFSTGKLVKLLVCSYSDYVRIFVNTTVQSCGRSRLNFVITFPLLRSLCLVSLFLYDRNVCNFQPANRSIFSILKKTDKLIYYSVQIFNFSQLISTIGKAKSLTPSPCNLLHCKKSV